MITLALKMTNQTLIKVIIMKFLIVLVVITIVIVKAIFGVVEVAAETVYESSNKTEQVLNELEL